MGILRGLNGVKRAVVALATSLGEVEYDPSVISKDDIVAAIEDAGFEGSFVQSNGQDQIVLRVGGVYSLGDARVLEAMLSGIKGVKQFRFDSVLNELDVVFDPQVISSRSLVDRIELGSNGKFKLHVRNPYARMASKDGLETSPMFRLFISSLFLSVRFWSPTYFETSAMLITFVLLGKYLKCLAKGKNSDAIKKPVELTPATALLIVKDKGGRTIEEREIDSLLVQPGDTLKVLPGTKIPADGAFQKCTKGGERGMMRRDQKIKMGFGNQDLKVYEKRRRQVASELEEGEERERDITEWMHGNLGEEGGDTVHLVRSSAPFHLYFSVAVVLGLVLVEETFLCFTDYSEIKSQFQVSLFYPNSVLHIEATKVGSDTILSQIISLVETAQMSKAPIQKFADYVYSGALVPIRMAAGKWKPLCFCPYVFNICRGDCMSLCTSFGNTNCCHGGNRGWGQKWRVN
ncbi:Copper-transporting ATPase RAN1 [Spatholobus suberectus]|nr:Copper-transporting ATPase RAN1 [Spatholobus suberectus]